MSSVLSSFFSRDPKAAFPYELPAESFTTVQQDIFVGKSFKKNDPQEKTTCFWSSSTSSSSLKTQTQKLKTLRHPNVLTYVDSLEVAGTFYLITEPCRPLTYYLNDSKLTDTQRELLVSWGLYQVLNCLKFLHNEAQLSQNNLRNAVFVTASGDWKLAAFHLSGNMSSPQADLNDLASVLLRIFSKNSSSAAEQLPVASAAALQQIPKRLQPLYKRLATRGRSVMTVADILNECRSVGGFMKNKFVDTLLFLDEFQLREAAEKSAFFVQLNQNLDLFPEDIARDKILPKLIHSYEYGDAGALILVPMFKLGRLLEEEEYQQKIVPCLVKLFSSTDRTTRVKLLERIDEFAGHLRPPVVNEKIYSNLVTGFMDSNAAVRESTVKAMVAIAEKLNYANLNNDLMKYLARLQGSDPEPGIRTNTTICLGKIGCFIDPGHRQRILVSAFTRALRDPFPPARMAGIIALSATQQYFSLCEVAQKVLPALAPLTVDPEKQVRDQSFKALSGFVEKLQKASDNPKLIPELEAQVKAGGRGGLLSGDKVPQWAGWAIKAISGKFYKSTAAKEPAATSTAPAEGQTKAEEQPAKKTPLPGEASAGMPPRAGSISSSASQSSVKAETNSSSLMADGWGELKMDDEEDEDEEGKAVGGAVDSSDSDFGGDSRRKTASALTRMDSNSKDREDALWSAAMDSWEAVRESPTPSPKHSVLDSPRKSSITSTAKLNPPFSLSAPAESPVKKSSGPALKIPVEDTSKTKGTGKALKLGAVKKPQPKRDIDTDLDSLFGLDTKKPAESTLQAKKPASGMATTKEPSQKEEEEEQPAVGNFASVAKQISQQPPKPAAPQQKKKVETTPNNWQDW